MFECRVECMCVCVCVCIVCELWLLRRKEFNYYSAEVLSFFPPCPLVIKSCFLFMV